MILHDNGDITIRHEDLVMMVNTINSSHWKPAMVMEFLLTILGMDSTKVKKE